MAHIQSIGAGLYSELAYTSAAVASEPVNQAAYVALSYTNIDKIQSFPPVGTLATVSYTHLTLPTILRV